MARPTAVWIPFYVNDYFAKTMHLTARQHGAYCCLIFRYWQAGGPIPDNDRVLAGLAKETAEEWAEDAPAVRAFFYPLVFDGRPSLGHARIEEEIVRAAGTQELRKAQTERARAASIAAKERVTHPVTHPVTARESQSESEKKEKETKSLRDLSKKAKPRSQIGDFEPDFIAARDHWTRLGRNDLACEVGEQIAQFRDHHLKTASTMADWPAAWRTWYRNAPKMNRQERHGRGNDRPSPHETFAGAALDLIRERRSAGGKRRDDPGIAE